MSAWLSEATDCRRQRIFRPSSDNKYLARSRLGAEDEAELVFSSHHSIQHSLALVLSMMMTMTLMTHSVCCNISSIRKQKKRNKLIPASTIDSSRPNVAPSLRPRPQWWHRIQLCVKHESFGIFTNSVLESVNIWRSRIPLIDLLI